MILDTNAFFLPFQFRINMDISLRRVVGDCRYLTTESVRRELERLREKGERFGKEALRLFSHLSPEVWPLDGNADDDLMDLARKTGGAILTQDSELRHRALTSGIPVIFLRAGRYMEMVRPTGI